jgi:cell wall-associated NlpC family hydrolase
MFVFDRAKVRATALVMAATAAIQIFPNAYADEIAKATIAPEAEVKAQKKTKKKERDGHPANAVAQSSPWRLAPVAHQLHRTEVAVKREPSRADKISAVLKAAKQQIGKPYRWGAVGPSSFDCSGFTMFVWRRAGVHLPHNSGAQRGATKPVPLDEMKPGDLIFSSGHVGMYVGGGKMIHSPRSGRTVSIDPIHSNAYGAGRPLP